MRRSRAMPASPWSFTRLFVRACVCRQSPLQGPFQPHLRRGWQDSDWALKFPSALCPRTPLCSPVLMSAAVVPAMPPHPHTRLLVIAPALAPPESLRLLHRRVRPGSTPLRRRLWTDVLSCVPTVTPCCSVTVFVAWLLLCVQNARCCSQKPFLLRVFRGGGARWGATRHTTHTRSHSQSGSRKQRPPRHGSSAHHRCGEQPHQHVTLNTHTLGASPRPGTVPAACVRFHTVRMRARSCIGAVQRP